MKLLLFFLAAVAPIVPPGAVNPNVTQANIHQTVCVAGWTKTIRPPASYTNKLKLEQMAAQHLVGAPGHYEEDHFIPLEIGGHPTDPLNLWPQPWPEARLKDRLESYTHRQMCAGKMTLEQAQEIFLGDWRTTYDQVATAQGWPVRGR